MSYHLAMVTIAPVRLLGAAELGALLGVSRARVSQLTVKPWFPRPIVKLAMGAVWELADVERMAAETGRTLDYDALAALERGSSSPGRSSSGTTETAMQREP